MISRLLLAIALLHPLTLQNSSKPLNSVPTKEIRCLAEAIYHEARGEPIEGQYAVAYVIVNRTKHPKFPSTVCAVVRQPGQFTYKRTDRKIPDDYKRLAYKALTEKYKFDALYFHSVKIQPNWSNKKYKKIGNHIFYV